MRKIAHQWVASIDEAGYYIQYNAPPKPMKDLNDLLTSALEQQSRRPKPGRARKLSAADDYAKRLAERALFRRLILDSNVAQDGIRFSFWFSGPGSCGLSLQEWRDLIDREMLNARKRKALNDQPK